MYKEATAAARLQKLETENTALKEQLETVLQAMAPAAAGAGGGGVSAAGAAGWGRGAPEPPYDETGVRPPTKVGPETPPWLVDTV